MAIENIEVDDYDPLAPSVSVVAYTGGEEVGGVNLGVGYPVFKEKTGAAFRFRTIQAGDGVSITEGDNSLLFSFDAQDLDLDQIEFGSTDNLMEGNNNLYYTNTRVRQALSVAPDSNPALVYRPSVGEFSLVGDIYGTVDFDTDFAAKTTADLAESPSATTSNGQMYYTDARVRAAISGAGDVAYDPASGEISITTYKSANFNSDFGTKSTDDLLQGSANLYYTDAKVGTYLNNNGYLTIGAADAKYIPNTHPTNGITQTNINDWNAMLAGTVVQWANITDKPTWVNGTGATTGQFLVWQGSDWGSQTVSVPTDVSDLTDTTNLLDHTPEWAEVQNKPVSFNPAAHTHPISEITNLQTELNNKALTAHTHLIADTVGLQAALDTKLEAETLTTLAFAANTLTYTDELGNDTNVDLSIFLDDTNLAYIVSGVYNGGTELITFTRSDMTTFDINVAALSQIKTLEALTDTAVSGAQADGTVLTWNDTAQKWEAQLPTYFDGEYASLQNIPAEFAPAAHTHTLTDITDGVDTLDTLLADKSDVIHAHIAADITDFVSAVQDVVIDGGTY